MGSSGGFLFLSSLYLSRCEVLNVSGANCTCSSLLCGGYDLDLNDMSLVPLETRENSKEDV